MYSLVSAAVLAQDLLRHPYSVGLLDTVERVLALDEGELAALDRLAAEAAPEPVRRRVLSACAQPPTTSAALRLLGSEVGRGGSEVHGVITALDGALLGTLSDLQALLVRERPLCAATPAAQQAALDAVSVAWAGRAVSTADAVLMRGPWERGVSPLPQPLLASWAGSRSPLTRLLDEVPRRTREQWDRSIAARRPRLRDPSWAQAMHAASQAAHETSRLAEVARAQLTAARLLALTNPGVSPYDAGMVLSAAVQAACVCDVLPAQVSASLRREWEAGQ